jgi:hypothetical protein
MSTIEEIERAVEGLSRDDLRKFREWFQEFHDNLWDEEIARDVAAGRLDALADEALAEHLAGRTRPL